MIFSYSVARDSIFDNRRACGLVGFGAHIPQRRGGAVRGVVSVAWFQQNKKRNKRTYITEWSSIHHMQVRECDRGIEIV